MAGLYGVMFKCVRDCQPVFQCGCTIHSHQQSMPVSVALHLSSTWDCRGFALAILKGVQWS